MNLTRTLVALAITTACGAAFAQAGTIQRDINQQERIQQGLKSGDLTTREAAKLEREESRVEKMQSNAMRDGKITPEERARLDRAQDKVSQDIYREKHDAQRGDPNSASSQRMQADVQRNINQQRRIEQGVQSGQLNTREAGRLERGEARINQREARAGRDGHVGAHEQRGIQRAENRESRQIHHEKHDRQTRHHRG